METVSENLAPRSYLVAGGRGEHHPGAAVNSPVDFTSTFRYEPGVEPAPEQPHYGRESVPSWQPLEQMLAQLEAGTRTSHSGEGLVTRAHEEPAEVLPGLLFSSGMAAISAVIHLMAPGGHLILPRHSYMGFATMTDRLAASGRVVIHRVDIAETEQVTATIDDVATLAQAQEAQVMLWIESPTNPMLEVADMPALIAAARRRNVLTAVDNTFATPLRQQPLRHGADVVVHSVTKFLAGHSDLIMGAAITPRADLHAALLEHRTLHGAIPGPMEAYLALRGLRTLAVRLEAAERNAAELAQRLAGIIGTSGLPVRAVTYPGLSSHPHYERAAEQLSGFGAIVTIEVSPVGELTEAQTADAVLSALQLWTPATSLGGVESLVERRRRHPGEPETVPEGLIRLSVGIEDVEDLWADLVSGLRTAASSE